MSKTISSAYCGPHAQCAAVALSILLISEPRQAHALLYIRNFRPRHPLFTAPEFFFIENFTINRKSGDAINLP